MKPDTSCLPPGPAGDVPALLVQAHEKLAAEDIVGALANYRQALQRQPDCVEGHVGSALALVLMGAAVPAKRAARAALALAPAHPLALKVLARVQLDWGNADLARDCCDTILAGNPEDAEALTMRAQCRTNEIILPVPEPGAGPGYDAYVSLGNNCEAGLQFKRIGYEESSFFRFTFNSYEAVLDVVRNDFAGVYERGNLRPHTNDMVRDHRYGVVFHSDLKSAQDPKTGLRAFLHSYDFDEVYGRRDRPKVRHLVAKWRALTRSEQNVLYIIKLYERDHRVQAGKLQALFQEKYPSHRCTFLCLQTTDPAETDWRIPGVVNRHLPRFAPFDNTHDADTAAWDRIFAEFPLRDRPTPFATTRANRSSSLQPAAAS